jgi:hypothetical protein
MDSEGNLAQRTYSEVSKFFRHGHDIP